MEFVLYSQPHVNDPLSIITRAWAALYQIDGFAEEAQKSYWNSAGELPVVRYNSYVFSKEHVLDFLRQTFDPDTDLTPQERTTGELLEEYVVGRLHAAVMYAKWMDDATSKDFFAPQGWWLWRLMSLPSTKLKFIREKSKVREYLAQQHEISSYREAAFQAEAVHQLLSEFLGNRQFFFSAEGRRDFPHSTDIVIYAYLADELASLPSTSPLVSTLCKYPNLYEFVRRMEGTLRLVLKAGLQKQSIAFKYATDSGLSEIFTPKLYASPHSSSPDFYKTLRFKGFTGVKRLEPSSTLSKKWQVYISGSAAVLFSFFLLKGTS
jgi:hypothetical protein